jgi:hypothetical protein
MTRTQIAALIALGGAGVIAIWSANGRAGRAERANAELAARMSTLEAAPKGASTRVIERTRVLAPPKQEPAQPADGVALELNPAEAPQSRTDAEITAAYAEEFANEPVDPGWARQARGDFLSGLENLMPPSSRLESFECRSKFCDLLVVHDSVDVSNDFLRRLFARDGPLGLTTGGFRSSEPVTTRDGKLSVHVYVARQGTSLALGEPSELELGPSGGI